MIDTKQLEDAYQKACGIADLLLSRGYPVSSYEARGSWIVIRFGGERSQTIHGDANDATFETFRDAYESAPPPGVSGDNAA